MPRKRRNPAGIAAALQQVDALVSQGESMADAVRDIGVTEVTYYRRRRESGRLKSDQVTRMQDLEAENARFRRAVVLSAAPQLNVKIELSVLKKGSRRRTQQGIRSSPVPQRTTRAAGMS